MVPALPLLTISLTVPEVDKERLPIYSRIRLCGFLGTRPEISDGDWLAARLLYATLGRCQETKYLPQITNDSNIMIKTLRTAAVIPSVKWADCSTEF